MFKSVKRSWDQIFENCWHKAKLALTDKTASACGQGTGRHATLLREQPCPVGSTASMQPLAEFHLPLEIIPNSYGNARDPEQPKESQKEQSWKSHTSWFQTYHETTAIDRVWCWRRYRAQWDRTENQDINPYLYGQVIFKWASRPFNGGRDSLFNKQRWDIRTSIC